MGQQQLLLVILVTIIVGVATVVAINVFGTSAINANKDAVRQDMLTIGSQAQGWYMKPTMMGGGGGSFQNITFDNMGFGYSQKISPTEVKNANGTYTIKVVNNKTTNDSLVISAVPVQEQDSTIVAGVVAGRITFK